MKPVIRNIFFCLLGMLLHGSLLAAPALMPARCAGVRLPVAADREVLQSVVHDYLQHSEELLSMRVKAIALYHELRARRSAKQPLTGYDLLRLNSGSVTLLEKRDQLMQQAFSYECWAYLPPPADAEAARLQKAGIMVSLAAALVLYDNYLSAVSLYYEDPGLRRHLNRPDTAFGLSAGMLNTLVQTFADPEKRNRVRKGIQWYEQYGRMPVTSADLEGVDYLFQSIEQSPSYHELERARPFREFTAHVDMLGQSSLGALVGIKNEGAHLFSGLFGNTIGLVEARRGKLDNRPEVTMQTREQLRAGDILLEKTPFRLTDAFIPGYWGHAAIWIGDEAELRALGIWDDPVVQPFQGRIRAGHGVVEALRSGVELNRLESFLNVDDLAVLRHTALEDQERAEIVLYTLRQIGKPYDFNFNVETTDRIFCSKLVYLAYGRLAWPTTRMLGRATVSPDSIAMLATDEGPLKLVLLYVSGDPVETAPQPYLAKLVRLDAREQQISLSRRSQGTLFGWD